LGEDLFQPDLLVSRAAPIIGGHLWLRSARMMGEA
jgi:hypothetical protein